MGKKKGAPLVNEDSLLGLARSPQSVSVRENALWRTRFKLIAWAGSGRLARDVAKRKGRGVPPIEEVTRLLKRFRINSIGSLGVSP